MKKHLRFIVSILIFSSILFSCTSEGHVAVLGDKGPRLAACYSKVSQVGISTSKINTIKVEILGCGRSVEK